MAGSLRIGVIGGGGWLGGAIARAVLDAGIVAADALSLSYRSRPAENVPGVHQTPDSQALVERSDLVVVSVRPADWPDLTVSAPGRLVVSVMAGIPLADLGRRLGTDRVVRALPNAAAAVRASHTPWIARAGLSDGDRVLVRRLLSACGTEDEVHRESDIDYLTGLSGSGPAFPALLADAMLRDAITRGLDPGVARRAVDAVFVGSGRLIEAYGIDPSDTVETFLAYRGTTAAAIEAMRAGGFDAAISAGLGAAFERASRMARGD